jgi:predicted ATPase
VGWVELAGVARPEDVGSAVARALAATPLQGESARETLCRHLASKRLLLTIDNFAHVLEAAGLLGELHGTCPELALLVTSRETLNLAATARHSPAPLRALPPARRASRPAPFDSR